MTYDCMTPEELALWQASRYAPASVPCVDCPAAFRLAEMAAGRCRFTRPRLEDTPPVLLQRERNRLWMRRRREALYAQRLQGAQS